MKYVYVIEKANDSSYSAYVPDLPGCVAVAKTPRQTLILIREAIELHLEDLRARGRPLPRATAMAEFVEVAV